MTKLEQLRALLKAATPGPWRYSKPYVRYGQRHIICEVRGQGTVADYDKNALLIAAAVNALPHLLDVAEAAQRAVHADYRCDIGDAENCDHCVVQQALAKLEAP